MEGLFGYKGGRLTPEGALHRSNKEAATERAAKRRKRDPKIPYSALAPTACGLGPNLQIESGTSDKKRKRASGGSASIIHPETSRTSDLIERKGRVSSRRPDRHRSIASQKRFSSSMQDPSEEALHPIPSPSRISTLPYGTGTDFPESMAALQGILGQPFVTLPPHMRAQLQQQQAVQHQQQASNGPQGPDNPRALNNQQTLNHPQIRRLARARSHQGMLTDQQLQVLAMQHVATHGGTTHRGVLERPRTLMASSARGDHQAQRQQEPYVIFFPPRQAGLHHLSSARNETRLQTDPIPLSRPPADRVALSKMQVALPGPHKRPGDDASFFLNYTISQNRTARNCSELRDQVCALQTTQCFNSRADSLSEVIKPISKLVGRKLPARNQPIFTIGDMI